MIDIAQVKIGDRWFLRFEESDIAADGIVELEPEKNPAGELTGVILVWMKNGAFRPRTPIKAEPEPLPCLGLACECFHRSGKTCAICEQAY